MASGSFLSAETGLISLQQNQGTAQHPNSLKAFTVSPHPAPLAWSTGHYLWQAVSHRPSPGMLLQRQLSCSCPSGELLQVEQCHPSKQSCRSPLAIPYGKAKHLRDRRMVSKAMSSSANTAVGQSVAMTDQATPRPPSCELRAGDRRGASNGDKSGFPVKQNKLCTSEGGNTNLAGCPAAVCPDIALHVLCKVRANNIDGALK